MRFSDLRHRLEIQAPIAAQDQTTGEPVLTWTTVATVWASIAPIRGIELLKGEQILAGVDTRLRFRWSPLLDGVTAGHRGVHQDTVFDFKGVTHVNLEQQVLEVLAKSGLNDG